MCIQVVEPVRYVLPYLDCSLLAQGHGLFTRLEFHFRMLDEALEAFADHIGFHLVVHQKGNSHAARVRRSVRGWQSIEVLLHF